MIDTVMRSAQSAGKNLAEGYAAFARAYNQGTQGKALQETGLDRQAAELAWHAGKEDRKAGERAGIGLAMDDYTANNLTDEERQELDSTAKALGIRVKFADALEGGAQGEYSKGTVLISKDAEDPLRFVYGHEITHRLQETAPKEYAALQEAMKQEYGEDLSQMVQNTIVRYGDAGVSLDEAGALDELTADFSGRLIRDRAVLETFIANNRENRSLLQRLLDAIRNMVRKLTGRQQAEARDAEQILLDALNAGAKGKNKNTAQEDGERKRSIVELSDGRKYVQADRQVIFGNDPEEWRRQTEDYINGKIRRGEDVYLLTEDGAELAITKDTAGKAKHKYWADGREMSEDELYLKLTAETHIDEIAKVSKLKNWKTDQDGIHGEMAKNGWDYRVAYFRDFDGKHYRLYISVAKSDTQDAVYNIGDIQRRSPPAVIGPSAKGGALKNGRTSSETMITEEESGVNEESKKSIRGGSEELDRAALLRQNRELKERVEELKRETRLTKKATTDRKAVRKAAEEMIRNLGADLETEDIAPELQELYDYLAGNGGPEGIRYEDAYGMARKIARVLVDNAVAKDDSLYREYSELRDYLRHKTIVVPEEVTHDIPDFEQYRRANFGRLVIAKNGTPNLDQVYTDLGGMWPEFFDPDDALAPSDQLERLVEVAGDIYTIYEMNPFRGQEDMVADELATEILETFFDLPQAKKTAADRLNERLRRENRERLQKRVQKERVAREKEVAALKDKYAQRTAAGKERQAAAELRRKITRHAKTLSEKLLRPTDKQHIPEEMRPAVAAVLNAINQESAFMIDPETGKRKKLQKDPETGERPFAEEGMTTKRSDAFRALQDSYREILDDSGNDLVVDPDLFDDDENQGLFSRVIAMGETRLTDLNSDQLADMWRLLKSVEHSVSMAGKVLSIEKYETTEALAESLLEDIRGRRKRMSKTGFTLDLEDPLTFFSHFGETGRALYRALRNAQDRQQIMVDETARKTRELVTAEQVKQLQETYKTFQTKGGPVTLSRAHMMELYLLMQREIGRQHIMIGGITQPEIPKLHIPEGRRDIRLSKKDVKEILGDLTAEEKEVADGLQSIISGDLSEYGNEASMKAYGYRKFTEEHYWPVKSSANALHENTESHQGGTNTRSIKNIGMTKNVNPKANNAVELRGVFNTFARHTSDMVDYAAWLCPMEDMSRLLNFEFLDDEGHKTGNRVKAMIDEYGGYGGKGTAVKYWNRLMEDIQNGLQTPADTSVAGLMNQGVSAFKGAAVGGNLRVVIQQPTAYFRALAVLSPADLIKGMGKGGGWKAAVEHSPIARRKAAGGFDISSPVALTETLFGLRSGMDRAKDAFTIAARAADEVTWGRLWNACEAAVQREQPELKKGSEDFYQAVNEKFTDLIDQTQVVDGVLQRNQIMRSNNELLKQASSFMGEPSKTVNMFLRSWDSYRYEQEPEARREALKQMRRVGTALVFTAVVNAVAQSVVDALRDEDDEPWKDKFLEAFIGLTGEEESAWDVAMALTVSGNLGGGLNPAGMIPLVKDVVSIFQGYDIARTDMETVSRFVQAAGGFAKNADGQRKKTLGAALANLLAAAGDMFGIPVSNLKRDSLAILRTIAQSTDNIPLQYEIEKGSYNIESRNNAKRFYDLAFAARQEGDEESYEHIRTDMIRAGVTDREKFEKAMRERLKASGGFTAAQEAHAAALEDKLENVRGYEDTAQEVRDRAAELLADYATQTTLQEQEEGYRMPDTYNWIGDAQGGRTAGLTPEEFILYKAALDVTRREQEDQRLNQKEFIQAVDDMEWLNDRERSYLFSTKYDSQKNNPWR